MGGAVPQGGARLCRDRPRRLQYATASFRLSRFVNLAPGTTRRDPAVPAAGSATSSAPSSSCCFLAVGVTAVMVTRSPFSSVAAAAPAAPGRVGDGDVGRRRDGRCHRHAGPSGLQRRRCRAARRRGPHRQPGPGARHRAPLPALEIGRYVPRSFPSVSAATRRPPTSASPGRGTSRSACGPASSSRWRHHDRDHRVSAATARRSATRARR